MESMTTTTIAQVVKDAKEKILGELYQRAESIVCLEACLEDPIDLTDTDGSNRDEWRARQIRAKESEAKRLRIQWFDFKEHLQNVPSDVRAEFVTGAAQEWKSSNEVLHSVLYNREYPY